jgi:hypothetical protein
MVSALFLSRYKLKIMQIYSSANFLFLFFSILTILKTIKKLKISQELLRTKKREYLPENVINFVCLITGRAQGCVDF